MKRKKMFLMVLAVMVFFAVSLFAELKTKFYGYQWIRYTDVIYGADIQSESGLSIPRTYLRWKMEDKDMGWVGEVTLDINMVKGGQEVSTSSANTGATDADGPGTTITVKHTHTYDKASGKVDFAIWPKYGYVDFTKIPFLSDIEAKLRVGIQKNYFGTVELWEYPLIEKEINDLRKVISSADLGIAILGELPEGYGSYELAMHNGKGYKHMEDNVEKQWSASLMVIPLTGLSMRYSYMLNNPSAHGTAEKTKRAQAAFVQYKTNIFIPFELLGEYVVVTDPAAGGSGKSGCSVGYMLFAKFDLVEWMNICVRYDNWNPDTYKTNDELNLYIAGINLRINENNLLQLNYQLEQPQFGDYAPTKHKNTWMAQLKWSW